MTVPNWLLKEYPEMALNLESNQDVLVSAFDLYQTLRQLPIYPLKMPHRESHGMTKGVSLLSNKLPKTRSCADAWIPMQFCICVPWVELSERELASINVGNTTNFGKIFNGILKTFIKMNTAIGYEPNLARNFFKPSDINANNVNTNSRNPNSEHCIPLEFDKVLFASKLTFAETLQASAKSTHNLYRVQVQVKMEPGVNIEGEEPRVFESLFSQAANLDSYTTLSLLETKQVTKYGNKPLCAREEDVKDICICKASKIQARRNF